MEINMLIINAVIYTMDGTVISDGYVEIKDGIIADVGEMQNAPLRTEIFDACGGVVVPGFIDAHTHIGMNVERKFKSPENYDYYAIDDMNFNDAYIRRAYTSGVVLAAVSPVSRCPVGGVVSIISTKDGTVYKKDAALKLSAGENPEKEFNMTCDTVLNIVKNAAENSTLPVHIHTHKDVKIQGAVLVHGTDADCGEIFAGPMLTDISKDEMKNLSYENLVRQYKNGAKIAITSDHPETPCDFLLLYAQLSAKYGVPYDDALKMITKNPAEMLGINAGMIKKGCHGGLLLFDKHPIDFYSKLLHVF